MNHGLFSNPSSEIKESLAPGEQTGGATGPRTPKGKERSSMNGVSHAITGQRIYLQRDEFLPYMLLGSQYMAELEPVGVCETQLAQRIIDINWRLHRIAAIETNIIQTGTFRRAQPAGKADQRSEEVAAQADAFRDECERTHAFDIMSRYDTRLNRILHQTTAELERLQAVRAKKEKPGFVLHECEAWQWYEKMALLHIELAASENDDEPQSQETYQSLTHPGNGTNETERDGVLLCTKRSSRPENKKPAALAASATHARGNSNGA